MKLIFEKSRPGRGCSILPPCDVPEASIPQSLARKKPAGLPCLDENEISRHYSTLAKRSFGVNDGFYPLGSCTMKYNPKVNEELARLPGFTDIHPLQDACTVQGCLRILDLAASYLNEISGMDAMSFQPAAGAHGELTGLLLFKRYHQSRGDSARTKIIIPDSAHGTNPASAAMAGFEVVNIPSGADGCVDLAALKAVLGPDTAGLMLTNPNTVGIFDPNITEITRLVHEAGGLNYYDGANLNAIMGIVRPGDMGFDVVHLNLHKSFSTPHGGGGPGSGAVGCEKNLAPFLPRSGTELEVAGQAQSIGRVRAFNGNFLIVVRAAAYLLTLGKEGIPDVAKNAVLNANYLMEKIRGKFPPAYEGPCMHEFVISVEKLKETHGVSALDIAKALQDRGMHPPTIYFPLIVHEALMVEPTETESKETLDDAARTFLSLFDEAEKHPESLHAAPMNSAIGRPDDVKAARQPVLRFRC
ncbi:aminomethyl-transferring glycine dehydrogenase subunit GcvPB [Leadbettera azotonutricia]|uniref:glycine dehydrogenase (aminomethyl-transferring) n=1 Tax=Leadbettera azotonutricia (strain ATCC BAA-888 / DSM 13862 / ZAS-9) TaxID=545695 RepID=F5YBS3_LEAAZ|nr:aminomethyl-transferring glycine dehydrogenase subunit GcvPB [Leadbettera azotonutricia]AEF82077.1 glycine dehydrogenase (decarboxylating) [Leadbettera azotonutricia ZAS-9]